MEETSDQRFCRRMEALAWTHGIALRWMDVKDRPAGIWVAQLRAWETAKTTKRMDVAVPEREICYYAGGPETLAELQFERVLREFERI